ncbi:MAG: SH3 domain-containing protein [Anaerolineaceae bacterium]|nr:SH3 domain-containing protein [Anaerolineaceae bacterium]
MVKKWAFFLVSLVLWSTLGSASGVLAQDDPNCPGAPPPLLVVGEHGRVLPGDANNVRDTPTRSGTKIGAIPGGEVFTVLEGPVCADGLNWWRVTYGDLTGWTVEGASGAYWVEPLFFIQPTATPDVPWLNAYRTPQHPIANALVADATARVQTMDDSPLPVYAVPGDDTPIEELPSGTLVTLAEEGANGWWRVESADGLSGWVREAVERVGTAARMSPTLAPVCVYTEDRVLFLGSDPALGVNLYSVALDGKHLCNLSYGLQQEFGAFAWSPDGQWVAYTAAIERGTPGNYGDLDLFIESVDGRVLRRLTFDQHVSQVQWTPDGNWIMVVMGGAEDYTRAIRLIAPDGTAERTVWTTDQSFNGMCLSPDGSQVATIEQDPEGTSSRVQVVDMATGEAREVFSSRWQTVGLNWSPDSAFLVTSSFFAGGEPGLIEIDVANTTYQEIVSEGTASATYSPDGTRIAYWSTVNFAPRSVKIYDRVTGELTTLASIPGLNRGGLSWLLGGDALLVTASNVRWMDASSGALRAIFLGESRGSTPPLMQPGGE